MPVQRMTHTNGMLHEALPLSAVPHNNVRNVSVMIMIQFINISHVTIHVKLYTVPIYLYRCRRGSLLRSSI